MTQGEVLDIARDALWVLIQTSGPLMIIALVVGLAVAIVQALTQIQEMTLVFVPKITAIFVALILMLPFIGAVLGGFMNRIMDRIATIG